MCNKSYAKLKVCFRIFFPFKTVSAGCDHFIWKDKVTLPWKKPSLTLLQASGWGDTQGVPNLHREGEGVGEGLWEGGSQEVGSELDVVSK